MSVRQDEWSETEEPFCEQLRTMGWEWVRVEPRGSRTPGDTGRRAFSEVVLEARLREALRRINTGVDGER